jgi:outer membrane lipoprotein LolB
MNRVSSLVAAAIVLGGCAHTGVVDDGLNYQQRQARLSDFSDWILRGRLVIDTGERGYQARVSWQQRGDGLELEVRGLLGAGSFRIEGNDTSLTVTRRGETEVLTDPERQLSAMFGWWLPVTSLDSWLLGQPDTAYPANAGRGAAGTLASLEQRDWRIVYDEYQLAGGLLVPRRVTLSHQALELTLVTTDWQPADTEP